MVPWLSVQFLSWAMDRRAGCTQQHRVMQCPTLPVLHPLLLWWWAGKVPAPMLEGHGQRPWVAIRPSVTLCGAFLKYHTRIQNLKYQQAFENKSLYFKFLFDHFCLLNTRSVLRRLVPLTATAVCPWVVPVMLYLTCLDVWTSLLPKSSCTIAIRNFEWSLWWLYEIMRKAAPRIDPILSFIPTQL